MQNFSSLFIRIDSIKQWCQKIGSESAKSKNPFPIFEIESQSHCSKSHFPSPKKGKSQFPFYPFTPLFVKCPYLSGAPICRCPYMSDAPICQMPLFVRCPYMSDAPICQMPLYVRCPYMSDAPICQMPLYVRCPYMSCAPICQVRKVYKRNAKTLIYAVCRKWELLISPILPL